MQQNADKPMEALKKSGWKTYERIAEMPFWDEYAEDLKSDIAAFLWIGGDEITR